MMKKWEPNNERSARSKTRLISQEEIAKYSWVIVYYNLGIYDSSMTHSYVSTLI